MVRRIAALSGIVLALGLSMPVAANTQDRFTIDDVLRNEYSCGVVETTHVTGFGIAQFGGDGTFQFVSIQLTYEGTFTDPQTGRTITQRARQHEVFDGSTVTLTGQGVLLRMQGEGIVQHDVGRLVGDAGDGSTLFATPKVIGFDDPEAEGRIDAAVCGMFD